MSKSKLAYNQSHRWDVASRAAPYPIHYVFKHNANSLISTFNYE
jgi:hypothetical protein